MAAIYDCEYEALIQYGFGFIREPDLIEDAIHDIFLYIWQSRTKLSPRVKIRAYLFVSLRHKLLALMKKRANQELKSDSQSFIRDDNSAEDKLIQAEFRRELMNSLNEGFQQLRSREREAISLRYYEKMAYEDISKVMGINYQSVRNLICTGTKRLSEILQKKL